MRAGFLENVGEEVYGTAVIPDASSGVSREATFTTFRARLREESASR